MNENKQKILDSLLNTINLTDRNKPEGNYIKDLLYIQRRDCKDMWGKPLPNGNYVRVIFADNPERNDGYYDINVDCSSGWGMIYDVVKYLQKIL